MSTPPDPFENDIRALQRRALPADWRGEILSAASAAASAAPVKRHAPRWLVAGLSTAWAAILLMHFTMPADPQPQPPSSATASMSGVAPLRWDQRAAVINDLLAAN